MKLKKLDEMSSELVKRIVAEVTTQSFGVVAMSAKNEINDIVRLLKKEDNTKGVSVLKDEENKLHISVYTVVEFGIRANVVADNLMDAIKYNVEKQTGFKIKKINVYVQSVRA